MNTTINNIKQWAITRGLDTADPKAQMCKLMEEAGELAAAINKDQGEEEIADAIGDCVVVLTILGMQTGVDIEQSVRAAYEEIKDRTGIMINGVFVKDGDESLEYAEAKRRQAMMESPCASPCQSCGGCKHLDESTDEYAPRPSDRPKPEV